MGLMVTHTGNGCMAGNRNNLWFSIKRAELQCGKIKKWLNIHVMWSRPPSIGSYLSPGSSSLAPHPHLNLNWVWVHRFLCTELSWLLSPLLRLLHPSSWPAEFSPGTQIGCHLRKTCLFPARLLSAPMTPCLSIFPAICLSKLARMPRPPCLSHWAGDHTHGPSGSDVALRQNIAIWPPPFGPS